MDEDSRTIYCGNLSSKCTEEILYELFLQAGPLEKVNIPKDRDGNIKTFGFVTFKHESSVPYAIELFEGTSLFNRQLMIKARQAEQQPAPLYPKNNGPMMHEISQYGNNVLMGYGMPNFAMNMPMNMMPVYNPVGMMPYPSQIDQYSHGKDRHSSRNQPYNRDRERDRHRERERDHDRGHHRDSRSHRSNNHHRSGGRSYR